MNTRDQAKGSNRLLFIISTSLFLPQHTCSPLPHLSCKSTQANSHLQIDITGCNITVRPSNLVLAVSSKWEQFQAKPMDFRNMILIFQHFTVVVIMLFFNKQKSMTWNSQCVLWNVCWQSLPLPGSFLTDISYTLWYFSINGIQATSLANRYIMSAPVMSLSKMKQLGDFSSVPLPVFPGHFYQCFC